MLIDVDKLIHDAFEALVQQWQESGLAIDEMNEKVENFDFVSLFTDISEKYSVHILSTSDEAMHETLKRARLQKTKFCANLEQNWGRCFDQSELLYYTLGYIFPQYIKKVEERVSEEERESKKYTYHCIHMLFCRAMQIYAEILCLVQNGFPDAAFARWRTMYEITCIAEFISQNGEEIAKAYYNDKGNNNLWAKNAPCFRNNPKIQTYKRIYFSTIENQCEFSREGWNDVYKEACMPIHGGRNGTFIRSGLPNKRDSIPIGALDDGIAYPAVKAAFTLRIMACIFFFVFPSIESVAYVQYLIKVTDRLYEEYLKTDQIQFPDRYKEDTGCGGNGQ